MLSYCIDDIKYRITDNMKIIVILILTLSLKVQYCLIGIWLHENGVLGSRPDGIVRQPALFGYCYQDPVLADMLQLYNFRPEILEVKCPFSAKDMTIPEAIETLNEFCLGWLQL